MNNELCEKIKEVLIYYVEHIQPVYTYLVVLKDKKPLQVIIEIENTFAHLAEAIHEAQKNEKDKTKIRNNIQRAKNHLNRLETDVYKLLLVELKRRLNIERKNQREIIQLSQKARNTELKEIGADDKGHQRVIEAYKKAVTTSIKELELPPLFENQTLKNKT